MLLLHADHLFAQPLVDGRVGILRRRVGVAVIDGVDAEEQIVLGEIRVDAGGAEIFADMLRRIGERFGNAARRAVRLSNSGPLAPARAPSSGCTLATAAAREASSGTKRDVRSSPDSAGNLRSCRRQRALSWRSGPPSAAPKLLR